MPTYRTTEKSSFFIRHRFFLDKPCNKYGANIASVGVVEGYPDGTFQPEKNISREEVAAVMYRYSRYQGNDVSAEGDLSVFSDADLVKWSRPYMVWAVGEGIINGFGGYLNPQDPAMRSRVAAILMRYCVG